ncbi:MAG: hypothetical protein ACREEM_06540 [Blastocatellia bacterium]
MSKKKSDITNILVDRIGANSRIERLAQEVDGTIIQMSAGYWPQQAAQGLNRVLGFKHKLLNLKPAQVEEFLKRQLQQTPLEKFIGMKGE